MKEPSQTGILRYKERERHGIVLRREALAKGLPRFFTGYPCSRGHLEERDTKTGKCLACADADAKQQAKKRGLFPDHDAENYELHAMFKDQKGLCAICDDPVSLRQEGEAQRSAFVDHCHETGKIRGILCRRCNSGLGFFRDSPTTLERAIEYLEASLPLVPVDIPRSNIATKRRAR